MVRIQIEDLQQGQAEPAFVIHREGAAPVRAQRVYVKGASMLEWDNGVPCIETMGPVGWEE